MTTDATEALKHRLGVGRRRLPRWVWTVALVGALGGGGLWLWRQLTEPPPPPRYRAVAVDRGDIATRVSATGTLEPLRVVEIGPEISGRIVEVLVAENDVVTAGQVLARFDEAPIQARLESARAQLAVAEARVLEVRAGLQEATSVRRRAARLREGGVNAEREAEGAEAGFGRARAQLGQAEAQVRQAKAQVTLVEDELARATLRAPIDGVVLTRAVEPGKAVAASLQTPVLFTLAADLRHMELQLAIDEADVAQVRPGLPAEFTVDAWPRRTFPATVTKVHMSPTVAQNLVTYRALLAVDNAGLMLLPGMTATASITASTVAGVLRVPNAALRFAPPRPRGNGGGGGSPLMPSMRGGGQGEGAAPGEAGRPRVHVLRDGVPARVMVETGATDGQHTEVIGGELKEGELVVVGLEARGGEEAETAPKDRVPPGPTTAPKDRVPPGPTTAPKDRVPPGPTTAPKDRVPPGPTTAPKDAPAAGAPAAGRKAVGGAGGPHATQRAP
jgi:HlyD family secretion protein